MYTKHSRLIVLIAILISPLFYSFSSIEAQYVELYMVDAPHIANNSKLAYKKDAARLALSHVADGRSLLDVGVYIPEDIQESLFNALMHIHNSNDPNAQKVISMGIHTKAKPYYIDRIEINCTPEVKWTKPLESGGTTTSNEKVNNELDEYELEIVDYSKEKNSFVISARNPLNMRKLARDLSKIDSGIEFVEVPEINETDHNIEATHVEGDTWIITFHKGKNKWSFEVDGAGRVLYQGK